MYGRNLTRKYCTTVGAAASGAIERNLLEQFEISNKGILNHDEGIDELTAIFYGLRMLQAQDQAREVVRNCVLEVSTLETLPNARNATNN